MPFTKHQIPWNKGVKMRVETKIKLSNSLKGRKVWNKGIITKMKGVPHSKQHTINASNAKKGKPLLKLRGKLNHRYGKSPVHPKRYKYKKYYFRSKWELRFAQYLDSKNLSWQYEPKRFYFEDCSYLPDFYVTEWKSYVEIKGWLKEGDIKKINLFYENYPDEGLIYLDFEKLKTLNII